jgi:hypothetical protein
MRPRVTSVPTTWITYSPLVVSQDPEISKTCKFSICHHMSEKEFTKYKNARLIFGEYHSYRNYALKCNVIMETSEFEDTFYALRSYKDVIDKQLYGLLSIV